MAKYISHFQSVITISVMEEGDSPEDASKKAIAQLKDKDCVNHCFYDQTDFELAGVEEWDAPSDKLPKLEDAFGMQVQLSDRVKSVMATRLGKSVEEMTPEDYVRFIQESVEASVEHMDN
jgi:hypothetical protein